jgi:hypothetical protein
MIPVYHKTGTFTEDYAGQQVKKLTATSWKSCDYLIRSHFLVLRIATTFTFEIIGEYKCPSNTVVRTFASGDFSDCSRLPFSPRKVTP